jgi:hypothetical protein
MSQIKNLVFLNMKKDLFYNGLIEEKSSGLFFWAFFQLYVGAALINS